MPTYSYRCEKCGKKFDRTETMSEHEAAKAKCAKCGSKNRGVCCTGPRLRGDYEEKLTNGNIMKGPPSGQGPFAFATAGTTTQVRATQYWRPSTAYW